jgi:hypothetical protein
LAYGAVAVFAVALLATILGLHRIGDYYTETDFYGGYAEGARLIQQGRLVVSRYGVVGPLFEIVLALVGRLGHDLYAPAQGIAAGAAVAFALLWFLTVRRLVDARLGLWTTLFLVSNATLFRYGSSATTDTLALALQAAALWWLLTRPRRPIVAGLLAALALLTRYSSAYLLPAGVLLLAAGVGGGGHRARRVLGFVAGWALPVLLWIVYARMHGSGPPFELYHGFAYEMYARPAGLAWDQYQRTMHPQFHGLWDVLSREPTAIASRLLANLGDHVVRDGRELLGWPVAVCAVLGALLGRWDRGWRRLWPVALTGTLAFVIVLPTFHSARYSLAVLPLYATAAGWLVASPRWMFRIRAVRGPGLKRVLALVPVGLAVHGVVTTQATVLGELPVEVRTVAPFLRAHAVPGDRVIARKPHLSYYSGVPDVPFPFVDSLPDLARFARAQHVRWLYFAWPEAQTRPRISYLLDPTAAVPGLTPRLVTTRHPSVLYEIGPRFGERAGWMANDTLVTWHLACSQLLADSNHAEARFAVAMVKASRGRYAEARADLERLVRGTRPSPAPQRLLGEVELRQDDAADAERAFRRALVLGPHDAAAEAGLGYVRLLQGRPEQAVAIWRSVVGAEPDPDVLCRLAFQATRDPRDVPRTRAALASVSSPWGRPSPAGP